MQEKSRAIILVDMDCFYVQVEQRQQPQFKGQPCALVQYNQWKKGGIIAVSYEARAEGVNRQMRGEEALGRCPSLHLFQVPLLRGKGDLAKYRDASAEVMAVLDRFSDCVERASVDEAFIDISQEVLKRMEAVKSSGVDLESTYIVGEEQSVAASNGWCRAALGGHPGRCSESAGLAVAAVIAEEIRHAVLRETDFHCSAGIAHNKVLAKLACGLNKPQKQTILPRTAVEELFSTFPLRKVRNLGGKLGEQVQSAFQVQYIGEVLKFSEKQLTEKLGPKYGAFLYNLCRGSDNEEVKHRMLPMSIACGKNFWGREKLNTRDKVQHWLTQFVEELFERLEIDQKKYGRYASHISASLKPDGCTAVSRSCAMPSTKSQLIKLTMDLLSEFNSSSRSEMWDPPLINLSICASKFTERKFDNRIAISNYFEKSVKSVTTKDVVEGNVQVCATSCASTRAQNESNDVVGPRHTKSDVNRGEDSEQSGILQWAHSSSGRECREDESWCERCHKFILVWDVPQHDDFHFALDLQKSQKTTEGSSRPDLKGKRKKGESSSEGIMKYFRKH